MDPPVDNESLTQYCPACDYDLCGLTGDVCPECGSQFDRAELAWRTQPPADESTVAWGAWLFMLVLAVCTYSTGPQPGLWSVDVGLAALRWTLAGFWIWWDYPRWRRPEHAQSLLWLVFPCLAAVHLSHAAGSVYAAAVTLSIVVGVAAIGYAFVRNWRGSVRGVLAFFGVVVGFGALAALAVGAIGSVRGAWPGAFKLHGYEFAADRDGAAVMFFGGGVVNALAAGLFWYVRASIPPRSKPRT